MRTASGNATFSCSSRNLKTSPPAPQPKQWKNPLSGLTWNDGVFSEWNGQRPLYVVPARFSGTYSCTTCTRFACWRRSSMNCWGNKAMSCTNAGMQECKNPRTPPCIHAFVHVCITSSLLQLHYCHAPSSLLGGRGCEPGDQRVLL